MSVASHLGINLAEYDARIRTFIPDYEEMLEVAADAVPAAARTIVDVGTGTGALASRCLRRARSARLVGIDKDPDVLAVARRRLGVRASFVTGSVLTAAIPPCDAIVMSLALHHIRTRDAKVRLYRRFRTALRRGGRVISVDCHPSARPSIAHAQMDAWTGHLRRTYSGAAAKRLFMAWRKEDSYMPLDVEVGLAERAGFSMDVVWRKGAFAVLVGS